MTPAVVQCWIPFLPEIGDLEMLPESLDHLTTFVKIFAAQLHFPCFEEMFHLLAQKTPHKTGVRKSELQGTENRGTQG